MCGITHGSASDMAASSSEEQIPDTTRFGKSTYTWEHNMQLSAAICSSRKLPQGHKEPKDLSRA